MNNYLQSAIFLIIAACLNITNQILIKITTANLIDYIIITGIVSYIILLPLIWKNKCTIKSKFLTIYILRSSLFLCATLCMFFSIKNFSSFSIALTLICRNLLTSFIAVLFLKEKLKGRILPMFLSIIGILIISVPYIEKMPSNFITLAISIICFSIIDILSKYLLNNKESPIIMIFMLTISYAMFFPFFSFNIDGCNALILLLISIIWILTIFALLTAAKLSNVIPLQTLRYIELPLAIIIDAVLFQKSINNMTIIGFLIICIAISLNIKEERRIS